MKLPPSSALASIALANLPLISASAILNSIRHEYNSNRDRNNADTGILQTTDGNNNNNNAPSSFLRKLQLQPTCPSGCSTALCTCFSTNESSSSSSTTTQLLSCGQELTDVCTGYSGSLVDCITGAVDLLFPNNNNNNNNVIAADYIYNYQEVYCPLASCHAANTNNGEFDCRCNKYVDLCVLIQKEEGVVNELYCGIAACCAGAVDDDARSVCLSDDAITSDNNTNDGGGDSDVVDSVSTVSDVVDSIIVTASPLKSTLAPMAVPTIKPETLSPVDTTTVTTVEQAEVVTAEEEDTTANHDNDDSSSQSNLNASAIAALGVSAYIVLACGVSVGLWIIQNTRRNST